MVTPVRELGEAADVELKKLLEVKNITLEAAMGKVRKCKASSKKENQMVTPVRELGASGNVVEETSGHGFGEKSCKTCFNCGKEGHFVQDRNCPARGRKSSSCSKYGHYANYCKGGRSPKPGKQSTTLQQGGGQRRHVQGKQAKFVEGHFENSDEDDTFCFYYRRTDMCSVDVS